MNAERAQAKEEKLLRILGATCGRIKNERPWKRVSEYVNLQQVWLRREDKVIPCRTVGSKVFRLILKSRRLDNI